MNIYNMFIFEMCKIQSSEASTIKLLYEQMVDALYDDTGWQKDSEEKERKDEEQLDEIQKLILRAVKAESLGAENLFADRQPYSRANAKGMIDYFLNK